MKFYAIEERLEEAIAECRTKVRVEVSIDFTGVGEYISLPECDILELVITTLREKSGGTVTRGVLLLDNTLGTYCPRTFDTYRPTYNKYNGLVQSDGLGNLRSGRQVKISYTTGNDIPFVKRFILYVDDNGFQQTSTGTKERTTKVSLEDLSAKLKKTDKTKDWTENAVLIKSVICDKEFPAKSLVHKIAVRAGLETNDIDCSTITEYIPYVQLSRSVWDELSDLATIYQAHLETAAEKQLVFVNTDDPVQYTLDSSNVTHIRLYELQDQYRNTIRCKWTRYREFSNQELWRYADAPVIYTQSLTPTFPFVFKGEKRNIEKPDYKAKYTITTDEGKTLSVVHAENVDSKESFENNMITSGPTLTVLAYDVTGLPSRAALQLGTESDTTLLYAGIRGDAIAGELNFCQYLSDPEGIAKNGTCALNVTTPYMSETLRDGVSYFVWWTTKVLAKLKRNRKAFFVKTNRGLFHARVGAAVAVNLPAGLTCERAEIVEMELRYKKHEAFVASFVLEEE